nr:short-chain collagen C4-like [Crassostrea gigas]
MFYVRLAHLLSQDRMVFQILLVFCVVVYVETNKESCKDLLQGYLTGQLSSALGRYQVKALRRDFESFSNDVKKALKEVKEKQVADIKMIQEIQNSSIVYTRWGKKTCPSNAEQVISGYVGGSWYDHTGAAVNPLCLPKNPEWGIYKDGTDGDKAYMYGGEYQTDTVPSYMKTLYQHDVPCVVCLVRKRSVVQMFPARKTCYAGWKLEYQGYLMAGYHGYKAGSTYTCVDSHPDTVHGGHADKNGYLFYPVEARCGTLKCPPYVEGREVVCVVCSKE